MDEMITRDEAARILGLKRPERVSDLIRRGRLTGYHVGERSERTLLRRDEVEAEQRRRLADLRERLARLPEPPF